MKPRPSTKLFRRRRLNVLSSMRARRLPLWRTPTSVMRVYISFVTLFHIRSHSHFCPVLSSSFADRKTFTWEGLNYHVPVPGGTKQLLTDVYGYVKPGTLTALMGASGAGKTTCLDVLAQRKNIGVITGDILVDGRPLNSDFARGTAYAEQMDVHEGTATIREAMRFSAYLRQPAEISKEEKDAYVEEMIELLELQDLADAIVDGLGVEARKRLTIGVELASKPELLLFLDEPTSGLDAQSAVCLSAVATSCLF